MASSAQQKPSSESDAPVLRDLHGRKLNNVNDSYRLPADLVERDRQELLHEILKSATGGLYLAREAVHRALSPSRDGTVPRVLDIGTGSGKWAIEMAKEFPHAEVVGLDLAPVNPSSDVPPNCGFILGNCETCLDDPSYESAFDMIHARFIAADVFEYRGLIQHIWKALRPGGVFLAIEGRPGSFNEHRQQLGVQDEDDPVS
ncbi:hypothetical protein FRC00_001682 [Tulasnella sp. 408]|nr:hypothetical protein FRC00_001682 [Tulasnella sp. 408]